MSQEIIEKIINDIYQTFIIPDHETLTLEILCTPLTDGPHKGKTLLWVFADIAVGNHYPDLFRIAWSKFQNEITIQDILLSVENSSTVLWSLMGAASLGFPDLFKSVWDRFHQNITLQDLRVTSEGSPALWLLAASASIQDCRLFQLIWNQFKTQMTPYDLQLEASDHTHQYRTVLWCLAWASYNPSLSVEHRHVHKSILNEIASQLPNVLSSFEITNLIYNDPVKLSINDMVQTDKAWSTHILPCLKARNVFFQHLANLSLILADEALTDTMWQASKVIAKNTKAAGYCNAFYDLGKILLSKHPERAFEAFELVPEDSWYFNTINGLLSNHALTQLEAARKARIKSTQRTQLLKETLGCALHISDESIRHNLIQQIAGVYLPSFELKPIKAHSLLVMTKHVNADWCFKELDRIVKARLRKEKLKRLQPKLTISPPPQTNKRDAHPVSMREKPSKHRNFDNEEGARSIIFSFDSLSLGPNEAPSSSYTVPQKTPSHTDEKHTRAKSQRRT